MLEEKGDLVYFLIAAIALREAVEGCEVAPDDLVFRSLTADVVIIDAESHHINAHVGRRLVWIMTVDPLEDGVEHREYLYVAVVVDRCLTIGL